MNFYVYVFFRLDGRPFYVGYGKGGRWLQHERTARYPHERRNLHKLNIIRQIQAAGESVPKVKIREGLTEAIAKATEIALIAAIGREPHGPLVNATDGGEGTVNLSAEARERIAAAKRGSVRPPEMRRRIADAVRAYNLRPDIREANRLAHLGNKHTPTARAKMSESRKGVPHSASHVANQAAAQTGIPRTMTTPAQQRRIAALRGRKLSEEHRAKIAAGLLQFNSGKPKPPPSVQKPKRVPAPRPLCVVCGEPVKKASNKTCSYHCSNKVRWAQGIYTSALIDRMQAAKANDPDFPRRFKESMRKRGGDK